MEDIKKQQLSELHTLQAKLKELDSVTQHIADTRKSSDDISALDQRRFEVRPLPTNAHAKQVVALTEKKKQQEKHSLLIFRSVAISVIILSLVACLFIFGIFKKISQPTWLYTPEIVQEYSGISYDYLDHAYETKFVIESCNKRGKLKGYFSYVKQGRPADEANKYTFKGKVTRKSKEGYITVKLKNVTGSGGSVWNDCEVKIYNNYQVLKVFGNDMRFDMDLYAADYEKSPVTGLYTPEIIRTYTGTYKPYITYDAEGTATITITNCDQSGKIAGIFDYYIGDGHGQCEIHGQITEKHSDGSVSLTITFSRTIEPPDYYYPDGSYDFEIHNDYRSISCRELLVYWFYEDAGHIVNPDEAVTSDSISSIIKAVFIVVIHLAMLLVVILIKPAKKEIRFTEKELAELDSLARTDAANSAKNAQMQRKRDNELAEYRAQQKTKCNEELKKLEARRSVLLQQIQDIHVLAPQDKTIYIVEYVIEKMEGNRADSVKEALLLYDDMLRRNKEIELRANLQQMENRRRMQAEAEAALNQAFHNARVEREQRRQADELERIRKALEDN